MSNNIEHKGTVIAIDDKRVDVAITSHSACESCRMTSACGMGGEKEKIISVHVEHSQFFAVGEEVDVMVTTGMGMKAVTAAYIIPFFILLGSLILLLELNLGEVIAGLSALAATALYYVTLYFRRNKIEKELIFKIRKI